MPPFQTLPVANRGVQAFGGPPPDPNVPQFSDILNRLNKPTDIGQSDVFKQAVTASTPSNGISPQTQKILDIIQQRQKQSQDEGIAAAQSLAAKRGITGSSTEQFGTQQAIEQAQKTGQDATTAALTNDLNQNMDLKKLQIQGLFQGAGLQLNADTDLSKLAATLTSDQIASLNNMDFQNRSLALQQLLGQQGIDVARENIGASKDIANKNSQYGLLGAIAGGATPFALSRLFPAAAGGVGASGLGGAAGIAGVSGAGASGIPLVGAGGGAGAAGLGAAGTGAAIAGAGLGAMALDKYANNKLDLSGRFGNTGGAIARTALNPIGAQLNLAKNLINNPSQTVKKALGGKQGEQMHNSLAWAGGLSNAEVATELGKPGKLVNYDSNSKGSAERNWNTQLDQFTPDSLVARYSTIPKSQLGSARDSAMYDAYHQAVKMNGGQQLTGDQFSSYLKDNSHIVKAADIVGHVFAA